MTTKFIEEVKDLVMDLNDKYPFSIDPRKTENIDAILANKFGNEDVIILDRYEDN